LRKRTDTFKIAWKGYKTADFVAISIKKNNNKKFIFRETNGKTLCHFSVRQV